MKVIFKYSTDKDVWCLKNKGKSSHNSQKPTKVYQELSRRYGENPSNHDVVNFINAYLDEQNIHTTELLVRYQKEWGTIEQEFQKRAESVFLTSLPSDISAFLTVNNRSPYNIKENFFLCLRCF